MSNEARCPECNDVIEHLNYSADVREWGTCSLYGDDFNYSDADTGDTYYQCPECEKDINPDDIQYEEIEPPPPPTAKTLNQEMNR